MSVTGLPGPSLLPGVTGADDRGQPQACLVQAPMPCSRIGVLAKEHHLPAAPTPNPVPALLRWLLVARSPWAPAGGQGAECGGQGRASQGVAAAPRDPCEGCAAGEYTYPSPPSPKIGERVHRNHMK